MPDGTFPPPAVPASGDEAMIIHLVDDSPVNLDLVESVVRTVGPKLTLSLYIIATRMSLGYDEATSLVPGDAYTGAT